MGDLISRSVVIDVLKQTGIIQDNDLGHLVIDEINRIPTAYDPDAVVRELENHPNVFRELEGSYIPLDNAIEVVRSGDGKGWWNE